MDDLKPDPNFNLEKHLVQVAQREDALVAIVKEKLPDFVILCLETPQGAELILHQDAFAADYQDEEVKLLGMAIKYAGLNGRTVTILGSNRSSL